MLQNYFTANYLFTVGTPENQRLFLVIVGIFILFIIASILLSFSQTIHKGLKDRLFNFFLTSGILGIIISFFRWELIPYVGDRVVMMTLFVAMIIWYFAITFYSLTKMQSEIRVIKNHQRYVQYLPKQKKKK
jgi:uncharacterized membrane protein YdcZ (DUF606 family)